ncbi:MAG: tRNA (adenosine(37)-N6)-dimethylallyltransferase MiaA [Gemmatimonadota bacterium]
MPVPVTPHGLAIVGPTAVGKSDLALELAGRLGCEIVSVDSRQVYRGFDIGTAKASLAERALVPHHGIDLVEPEERYSAGRFGRDAARWIAQIRDRERVPLLVGGTGFFLRALTHPLFAEPPLPSGPRDALRSYLEQLSGEQRSRWLYALDPESARRLARGGGRQRELRALEVALLSGQPLSHWHAAGTARAAVPLLVVVLDLPTEILADRIGRRVERMLAAGLLEEIRGLAERHGTDVPAFGTTGYAEFVPWLRGGEAVADAAARLAANTRRLARRQRTWFRHQVAASALRLDASSGPSALTDAVLSRWARATEGVP